MNSTETENKTKTVFPLVCDNCNFSTDDINEFHKHLSDVLHVVIGSTLCNDCGKSTPYPKHPIKYGYDKKGNPNLVPETKCKKCQDEFDKETIKRLKTENKI